MHNSDSDTDSEECDYSDRNFQVESRQAKFVRYFLVYDDSWFVVLILLYISGQALKSFPYFYFKTFPRILIKLNLLRILRKAKYLCKDLSPLGKRKLY